MTRPVLATSNRVSDKAVRLQLERVLGGPTFQQADRLKRFLRFITLEVIEGRGSQLKEYVIGVQVFGKEVSFDPRTDPIVRVQARRLRARLDSYYRADGQNDDIIIELPKGGYAPIFRRRATTGTAGRAVGPAFISRNTVAVLPFADHSAQADLEYFCSGLRQEVIDCLARISGLRVLACDDSASKSNGAAMIVTGSVRSAGDSVRISVQLVDAANGCYLWSESLNGNVADSIGTQENVSRAVAARLQNELAAGSLGSRAIAENLAAHNLYLQGRYHLNQRTEEALRKALDFFEKALVEDGQYALAYSGISDAYGLLGHYGVLGPAEVWTKAASAAASAVMLDGN